MVSRISATDDFRLDLMGSAALIEIAVPMVSRSLGISPDEAFARLSRGPGTLATGLKLGCARRLATLLQVLGLPVRVGAGAACDAPSGPLFDIALQVTEPGLRLTVARRLADWLDLPAAAIAAELARPGGFQRQGLTWAQADLWRRRARSVVGLQVLVSDPTTARYDLLPWDRPANTRHLSALCRFLRRLGQASCPVTGAVAADIDRTTAFLILRKFPDCGLVALNRDFQRFDLVLAGSAVPVRHELAAFLAARTALPPQAFARPDKVAGLRIEGALCRADALAFQADYAAIGIDTRLRLVLERGDGPH